MNPPKRHYKNRILAALPKDEMRRLARHLSPVTLEQEKTLLDGKLSHAYFLEDGIASVVVTVENGDTVEVGYSTRTGLSPYILTDVEREAVRIF